MIILKGNFLGQGPHFPEVISGNGMNIGGNVKKVVAKISIGHAVSWE